MRKAGINFWPIGISLLILAVVGLILWTINLALNNPIQGDDSFLSTYQDADASINNIQKAQQEFLQNYEIIWSFDSADTQKISSHSRGQKASLLLYQLSFPEGFAFVVRQKNTQEILADATIEAILTRPHTKEEDRSLVFTQHGESYRTPAIEVPHYGRWVIQGVIRFKDANQQDKKGYFKQELFIQKNQ